MLRGIFKTSFSILLSVFSFPLILLTGIDIDMVNALSPESANGDNPLGIIIEPSDNEQTFNYEGNTSDEMTMEEIFGSEQVFPFEAGFGKNSGKD